MIDTTETNIVWGNRLGMTHRWHQTGDGYTAICGMTMASDEEPDGDDGSAGDVRICAVCNPESGAPPVAQAVQSSLPVWVEVDLIEDNPYQPRHEYKEDDLVQLVESIRQHGLLQVPMARLVDLDGTPLRSSPSLVLSTAGTVGRAQVAFGHRRLRAYRRLAESDSMMFGLMPLVFREMSDETMAAHAWSENRDRSDLSSWEEAKAIEKRMQVFGWNQTEAAKKMGMDRSTISNKLRLLKLPAAQQTALHAGELTERQAMALLPLLDLPEAVQRRDGWNEPAAILAQAKDQSSDVIRQTVESAMSRHTIPLTNVAFAEMEIDGDVTCSVCSDCPERIKYNGVYRCKNRECFNLKERWWIDALLAEAAAATGLPVGGITRDLPVSAGQDFYTDRESLQKIRETGCAKGNLKLFYRGVPGGLNNTMNPTYNTPEGFPQVAIVCHHGQRKSCTCLDAIKKDWIEARDEKDRQRKAEAAAIMQPAMDALLTGLRERHIEVWRVLALQLCFETRGQVEKMTTVEELEALVLNHLVLRFPGVSWQAREYPEQAQQSADNLLQMLGVCVQTPAETVCTQTPPACESFAAFLADPTIKPLFRDLENMASARGCSLSWDQHTWGYVLDGTRYNTIDDVRGALEQMEVAV